MTDPKDWPKNRELWIAALRDPERRQTTGKLGHQDHGGQCCLGVLAEIAGCEYRRSGLWDGKRDNAPSRAIDFVGLRMGNGAYFSDARSLVADNDPRSLVADNRPFLYVDPRSLVADNDDGKTFAEIADIIEEEPEGLFRA